MKRILLLCSLLIAVTGFGQITAVTINEINADNPGGGGPGGADAAEFVELFGPANQPLDGLVLVFYNGFTGFGANAVPDSVSYAAYDLDGYSTDAQGFFVLGSAVVPNVDMLFLNATNNIQNGADAIGLYIGDAVEFPIGTVATSSNLVDAIVYGTADPTANSLILAFDLNLNIPGYFQQDETTQQAGGADLTLSRVPDGGVAFDTSYALQALTPGTWNLPPCAGGMIYLADSTTALSICDNQAGLVNWTSFAGLGNAVTLIANDMGVIMATTLDTTYDFTGWIGSFTIQYLAYTNSLDLTTFEVGDTISQISADQCFSWSNAIELNFYVCSGCLGGEISTGNGAVTASIASDATSDILNLNTTSNSLTDTYQFALLDEVGLFIQWIDASFDFNTLMPGEYGVMGLSFEGNVLMELTAGMGVNNFETDLCSEWSFNTMTIHVVTVSNVVINELNADNPGGPDTQEFVELYGDPNATLDNLVAVFFNGANGLSYAAYDLDGYSLDANGFFVIGDANATNVDLIIPNGSLQNGGDAVAIFVGDSIQFLNGTSVHSVGLMDAMVYGTADASADNLISGLGLDIVMPGYMQMDETAQQTGIDLTLSRVPDGGIAFDYLSYLLQELTPGTYNIVILGCMDVLACNYNSDVTVDDGSCIFPGTICDDGNPNTINDVLDANCLCVGTLVSLGCMDMTACNYNVLATVDDGSCLFIGATCDDGDATTVNDIVDANCICSGAPGGVGCMDATACNYEPSAVTDDGSCLFIGQFCDDGDVSTINDVIDANCNCNGVIIIGVNEVEMSNALSLFPMPVSYELNISFNGRPNENLQVIIFNCQGQKVFSTNWKVNANRQVLKVNTEEWSAGMYFIQLSDAESKVSGMSFVVE